MKRNRSEDYDDLDHMDTLISLLQGMIHPSERINLTEVDGYQISTVNTHDSGLETAIISKKCNVYVLQRYQTLEQAKIGHEQWVNYIKKGNKNIIALGYMTVPDEEVTLE